MVKRRESLKMCGDPRANLERVGGVEENGRWKVPAADAIRTAVYFAFASMVFSSIVLGIAYFDNENPELKFIGMYAFFVGTTSAFVVYIAGFIRSLIILRWTNQLNHTALVDIC